MPCWSIIRTITEGDTMTAMHKPPHPGEVLREWLEGVSVTAAAERLGVTRVALSRVLNGAAGISPEWICA
jgi:addiction module HigA family antidote